MGAVRSGVIDVIATDHAPHTRQEKDQPYLEAPSGLPLIQHPLVLLLQLHHAGELPIEIAIERACHAPAKCFNIVDRGYLDEGCYADVVVVDPAVRWTIHREGLHYKCGWSPLEGHEVQGQVERTFVNGRQVYDRGQLRIDQPGMRLQFDR